MLLVAEERIRGALAGGLEDVDISTVKSSAKPRKKNTKGRTKQTGATAK